ncbi:MAG TPA: hypothetical protein VFJ98_10785, partial [Mycobacteriales bacterium]|nr:hypothetical protein [Mycobacteriales bacterium]
DADSGDIGSADFSVPAAPTSTLGLRDGVDLPGSVELAGAGDVLAAGVVASNAAVGVYDVSSGTPSAVTPAATPDFGGCASLRSLALTTDGSSLLLACGVPSKVVSVSTTDLTDGPTFPSGQSDHAAAAAAHDGFVAAGFDTADQHDVFVFSADGTKLASSYAFGSDALAVGGLQYGADGTLYAVSHDASYSHWSLHVLHDSTKYAVQIAATTTKPAHTGDPVTVSGTVGSTIDPFTTAPTVQLSRTDLAGRHADIASQQAGPDGSFTFTDSHQVGGRTIGGPVTYTVSFAGDDAHRAASHSVRLTIPRQPTSISIHSNRSTFGYGGLARIRVHLGVNPTFNSKRVAVYLTPYQGRRVRIANRDVDADGNLAMSHRVYRRSTFMAVFAGDFLHEPARDSVTVRAHGRITERLRGFYGSTGGYRLYHPGSSPELDGRLWPHQSGVCLIFRAQYHSNGAWHTASTSPCVSTNSEGRAAALLNNALDLPYRLRAEWRGSTLSMATHGAWMKLKFR